MQQGSFSLFFLLNSRQNNSHNLKRACTDIDPPFATWFVCMVCPFFNYSRAVKIESAFVCRKKIPWTFRNDLSGVLWCDCLLIQFVASLSYSKCCEKAVWEVGEVLLLSLCVGKVCFCKRVFSRSSLIEEMGCCFFLLINVLQVLMYFCITKVEGRSWSMKKFIPCVCLGLIVSFRSLRNNPANGWSIWPWQIGMFSHPFSWIQYHCCYLLVSVLVRRWWILN